MISNIKRYNESDRNIYVPSFERITTLLINDNYQNCGKKSTVTQQKLQLYDQKWDERDNKMQKDGEITFIFSKGLQSMWTAIKIIIISERDH